MTAAIGPSPEMYLKTLSELATDEEPVSISAVASRLGVSPVSASEMIHRLEARRMVRHRRYRGVSLTRSGRDHALALIRRHRLWECFLHHDLGLPWQAVHDLACELEHAAPDEVTDAIDRRMGRPAACPHGNAIPGRPGRKPAASRPLSEFAPGESGRLAAIHPETTEALAYLAESGLTPGVDLRVERIESVDGIRMVRAGSAVVAIGPELALRMRVEGRSR